MDDAENSNPNSSVFVDKLEILEFNLKKSIKAFLQDNERYLLCLETSESNLMCVLLAQTLRTLKKEKMLFVEKFTDFDGFVKCYKQENDYSKVAQVTDLLICKVKLNEPLEQYSNILQAWQTLVEEGSIKIIVILENSSYLHRIMMKIATVNVSKLRFTDELCQLWDEYDMLTHHDPKKDDQREKGEKIDKRVLQDKTDEEKADNQFPGKPQPKASLCQGEIVKLQNDEKLDICYRNVQLLLNTITPDNFCLLAKQICQQLIDCTELLQEVVDLIFEKAISEYKPNFISAYAMMCEKLETFRGTMVVVEITKGNRFRTLLVTRCQYEFEKQFGRTGIANKHQSGKTPEKEQELGMKQYDIKLRMRSLTFIRFLGELFKQGYLSVSIMKGCAQTLLDRKDEESLECLCELLTIIGKKFESKPFNNLNHIFNKIKEISEGETQEVSPRILFILRELIELKDSKWVYKPSGTKKKGIDLKNVRK